MNNNLPNISIVIPVRNEGQRILAAINSFVFGRSSNFLLEFIFVDDASNDGCCDEIELFLQETNRNIIIKKIRLNNWAGIPYSRNIGAKYASAPILLITDANVIAGTNWDIPIFKNIQPNTALCATIADTASNWKGYGCILHLPSMGVQWLPDYRLFNGYVPIMPCAGTIISRELFNKLGGYDTAMPIYGAAEAEFSVRLWLYGAVIKNIPELIFHHHFKVGSERENFIEQIQKIQMKNYLRFGLLYLDGISNTNKLFNYWFKIKPELFATCLAELDKVEINERRKYLRANLKYDFQWYSEIFKIKTLFNKN